MTYSVTRKYSLKQYENIDLGVEGLESKEEIKKTLTEFDSIVKEYKDKLNAKEEPFADKDKVSIG